MFGPNGMSGGIETNEIAGPDVDGSDAEAGWAGIETIEIHQTLQRPLEIADVVEAGGLDRPDGLQPRRQGPRGEETSRPSPRLRIPNDDSERGRRTDPSQDDAGYRLA
jgi:hypothetical protein